MNTSPQPIDTISISQDGITFNINTVSKVGETGSSCYIPSLDLGFSIMETDPAKFDPYIMAHINAFFDYWIEAKSWKKFILFIHKLGFREEKHAYIMKELLKNDRTDANFKVIPKTASEFGEGWQQMVPTTQTIFA